MINLFRILFSVLAMFSVASSLTAEMVHICLVENGNKCEVSVSRYEVFSGKIDVNDYQKSGDAKEYLAVLSGYYESARKNKKSEILTYFSQADGSFQNRKEEMERIPDMYASFFDVERVEVTNISRVDNYAMVGVEWFKRDGARLGRWIELLHCAPTCKLSDRLMSNDSAIQMLSIVTYPGKSVVKPVHNFTAMQSSTVSIYHGIFSANAIYFRKNNSAFSNVNARIQTLVKDIKKNAESHVGSAYMATVLPTFSKYWQDAKESVYCTSIQNGKEVGISLYSLAGYLNRSLNVKPILMIPGVKVDFYIYRSDISEDGNLLLVFPIGSNGKIISQADLKGNDLLIAQAIYTPAVLQAIESVQSSLFDDVDLLSK